MARIHYHDQQHTLQTKTPQLAPIAILENHLKIAAMRTVRCRPCRVEHFSTALQGGDFCIWLKMPIETFDAEGRGLLTTRPACSRFLPLLTVHCRARIH